MRVRRFVVKRELYEERQYLLGRLIPNNGTSISEMFETDEQISFRVYQDKQTIQFCQFVKLMPDNMDIAETRKKHNLHF